LAKHFYILSTGRCGTTFLSELITANDPSVKNIHQMADSKWINMRANLALANKTISGRFLASISRKFNDLRPPSSADPLRSVAYALYLKKLLEENPGLHDEVIIIHLVRDPRDFISSFMNWKNRKLSGKIAHHLTPFWMPEPGIIKKLSMSKFEHFCWIWERKNRLFFKDLSQYPGYHLFKMEDLRPGSDQLKQLLSMVLDKEDVITTIEGQKYNSTIKKDFPYWNKWTPGQARKLDSICSGMMMEFGYGGENAWLKLLDIDQHEE
jgi:hypothetical protein